ncbi:MAG: SNF2 helicase associated domain-containing protein [Kiritimatiellae bacterium]|nr:SNF2 helicase associated domain-containing protein [Kiritimatiellia bacterium]
MSPADFTFEQMIAWGGADVFNQALHSVKGKSVLSAHWNDETKTATGEVINKNGYSMQTGFVLNNRNIITSKCPCRLNVEMGQICSHVVALAIYLNNRMSNREAQEKYLREQRSLQRKQNTDPSLYIQRSSSGEQMYVSITWKPAFAEEFYSHGVNATLTLMNGKGVHFDPEDPALKKGVRLTSNGEILLSVLEDICEGPAKKNIVLKGGDFINVLQLMSQNAKTVKSFLQAFYDEEKGVYVVQPRAELPFEHNENDDRFIVCGNYGFVFSKPNGADNGGSFYPLEKVLPEPFQDVYKKAEIITRDMMPSFIKENLPVLRKLIEIEMFPSEDMFKFIPAQPKIILNVVGDKTSIKVTLQASYGDKKWECLSGNMNAIVKVDENDFLLYYTRNIAAEDEAIKIMKKTSLASAETRSSFWSTNQRDILNFFGTQMPLLNRYGWRIECTEKLEDILNSIKRIIPVVDVADSSNNSFEIGCTFDTHGYNIPHSDIYAAINKGDSFLEHNGELFLVDSDAVKSMGDIFSDCPTSDSSRRGHFKMSSIYASYVRSSLMALDAVDFEDDAAPKWREKSIERASDEGAKYESVDLGELDNVLRPYQKQGVYWMRFLERSGISGLLADEMGLGKTLQTLTWISLKRFDPQAMGKPALVVCPTSLVQNWNAEAEKFVPHLKKVVISGHDRSHHFDEIASADLVITSYALLQRDLEEAYKDITFSVVVLDEAQHIKNRSTRNAKSAKKLNSVCRLVLTGTPVENSVSDVWSIFDFLMPDYLGDYELFKINTEMPVASGGVAGKEALKKLHHKLNPFILRRLKQDVAKDLPDKIVKVAYCKMTPEQERWYFALLEKARSEIKNLVKEQGFNRAKVAILSTLMKLRQASCHLGLVKEFRQKHPSGLGDVDLSGKIDSFFELIDEAMDGGHRVLVFSQFVQMLSILQDELKKRGIKYCYLDGSTKDRLGECKKFNTDESIPLFLISLHAGGTGLNLTGADMVVHFDPWWNPAVEAQATDRAHRIGQKKTVYVVKMIAENTVEEKVLALQQKKQLIIDATIGTTDTQAINKMTYDDIKAIIGI